MRPSWQHYGTYDESAHPDLWDGVVGYLAPCLGPTGTRLHDVSRFNNWATLTNMDPPTDWVVDGGQYALDFDGTNDYVQTGSVFSVANAVTLSAWIYRNNDGNHVFFDKGNTINNFILFCGGGGLRLRGASSTELVGTYSTTGRWSHVVGTISGTTGTVYAEGVQLATGTVAAVGNTADVLTLGRYTTAGGGYSFNGRMSDAAVWNRSLTPNEIRRLYQLGRGGMLERRRRRRVYSVQADAVKSYLFVNRGQVIGGGTL
jgi:hypothetical protein